jgi:hypothetical protein
MRAEEAHELGNLAKATASSPAGDDISDSDYADNQQLARLGKKPVLKVMNEDQKPRALGKLTP